MVVLGIVAAALLAAVAWLAARQPAAGTSDPRVLAEVQGELRSLNDRLGRLEGHDTALREGFSSLSAGTTHLRTTAEAIRADLVQAREAIAEMQSAARARYELERATAESIRRLEAVIAGASSKGAAGENVVDAVFSRLPAEWQARNFRVGNRIVEFGLRLPNGLVLPIDSKWPATNLLEQFLGCDDPAELVRLRSQIESVVLEKAREVAKYLDPGLTAGFGIAVVPDAVFEVCGAAQVDALDHHVVVVGYGMFVPYLLLVFHTVLKTSQDIDLERLASYLDQVERSIRAVEEELEGRHARALTMLQNSRDDMRAYLGKVSAGLSAIQIRAGEPAAGELPGPPPAV
ncbi:MAG: hypothetical protein Kow0010_16060 [Dehalococcoidia bacterium]